MVISIGVDMAVQFVPVDVERRVFQASLLQMAPRAEGADDARSRALQDLLDSLASHWSENPYELRVGILEDEAPNAVALPGGAILVTSTLLDAIESKNELAFVLGHEIGHLKNRDHLRRLGRGVTIALLLSSVTGSTKGIAAPRIFDLAGQLTGRSFDRDEERAADRVGLELVYAEYGDVSGAIDFFKRLPERGGGLTGDLANYFETHPLNDDRVEALANQARDRGWPSAGRLHPVPPDLAGEPQSGRKP
jgi:predicted Zn-dependent protease